MRISVFTFVFSLFVLATTSVRADDVLQSPVRITASGKPIDTEVGHAAPYYGDIDGDGKKDLLVGQFGAGKLKVFRNTGSNSQPVYDGFEWFQAGGTDGSIPSG